MNPFSLKVSSRSRQWLSEQKEKTKKRVRKKEQMNPLSLEHPRLSGEYA